MLDSLPGCQYRMTSYDDDVDRSDLNPAYGIVVVVVCINAYKHNSTK